MNNNIVINILSRHTYRTNFNDWYINPDCDVEISADGLTAKIKKFNPVKWCLRSNETTTTNTFIAQRYSHWKLNIKNLNAIYNTSNNIDLLPFRCTGDGNSIYKVHGVMVCPTMSNEEMFYRFPWDMGIPSGNWKDQNPGWQGFGYIYNGVKDRSPFNTFSDGWGANNNCQMAIGVYKNISPDTSKYIIADPLPTAVNSVDTTKEYIKYTRYGSNAIYKASITDGSITWTETGSYKEIVDISDNPIIVTIIPQDEQGVALHSSELWTGFIQGYNIRLYGKTVENCLMKYYNGYKTNDKIVIPYIMPEGRDTDKEIHYLIPNANEITDLYNYNPLNLRLEIDSPNTKSYVKWINKYFKSNYQDFWAIQNGTQKMCNLGGMCIRNTEDEPIEITFTSSRKHDNQRYYTMDYFAYNGGNSTNATGICRINYLKLIYRQGASGNYKFSTTYRMLQNFQGNIDIVHLDRNGNVVYPGVNCDFGFIPLQLNAAFEGAQIPIIKREWLTWTHLTNLPYAFEMNNNLTEIQANDGEEIVLFPHNYLNADEGRLGWPYFYRYTTDSNGNVTNKISVNEGYSIIQAFDRCPKLEKIEPILNVKYLPNESFVYYAFGSSPNITHLRLKGINNFNWDFTNTTNFGLTALDETSIKYIFDNAEDLVTTKYNQSNVNINNTHNDYPGIYFDAVNVRSSISENGLTINCPSEWQDKITDEMVTAINAKGWTVKINGVVYTV